MANGWRITRAGVVFVIGVLVLAGLVWGTIWVVRERGEQARREEAVAIAEKTLEEQSKTIVEEETKPAPAAETTVPPASESSQQVVAAAELPATGGEIGQLLAVSVLALSVAFYVSSRRQASHL